MGLVNNNIVDSLNLSGSHNVCSVSADSQTHQIGQNCEGFNVLGDFSIVALKSSLGFFLSLQQQELLLRVVYIEVREFLNKTDLVSHQTLKGTKYMTKVLAESTY